MHRVDPFPSQVASSTGSHRNPSTRALTAAAVGEPSLLRRGQRKLVCYLKSTVVELRFRGCQAAVLCFRCDMALTFHRVANLSSAKSFFLFLSLVSSEKHSALVLHSGPLPNLDSITGRAASNYFVCDRRNAAHLACKIFFYCSHRCLLWHPFCDT